MERYEGKVTHRYLDSKGFVTVGVGHLIKDLTSAQK
ncbi:MAG: GH24 family phage-related lysozyme (muramidase) [Candidatus Endobugula sp.]|jgi:GH24 family phage-related lysozyme (muramidase)